MFPLSGENILQYQILLSYRAITLNPPTNIMKPSWGRLLLTLIVLRPVYGAISPRQANKCIEVTIPVQVEAQNRIFQNLPDLLDASILLDSTTLLSIIEDDVFTSTPVSGSEVIAGEYCEPTSYDPKRANTLQLLVHGLTYTRDYWNGGVEHYQPANYSWTEYALSQGYPTLAIDRIGNGLSSHPDPILILQAPYQTRAMHALIDLIRGGNTTQMPRAFDSIVYVGHSFGSVLGDLVAREYPSDVDAMVLTGFSNTVLRSLPGVSLIAPIPAAVFDSQRFGTLPLGYVVSSSQSNRQATFLTRPIIDFDPEISKLDYEYQGTASVGEFITGFSGVTAASNYSGKVFVLSGEHDEIFCGLGNPILGPANCGTSAGGILKSTANLFPEAATYDFYPIPNTGHCLNFHYTAHDSYVRVHDWLDLEGF